MSISSHAICDHCERKLIPLDDESVTADYIVDSGWVSVRWAEAWDDDASSDLDKDFCSFKCAGQWCLAQVEETAERGAK